MSDLLAVINTKFRDYFLSSENLFFVNTQTNIKIKGGSRAVFAVRRFLLLLIVSGFVVVHFALAQEKTPFLADLVGIYEESSFEFVPLSEGPALTHISSANNIAELPAGEYQAVFRLKISDNTKADAVANISIVAGNNSESLSESIDPQDFNESGVFQKFVFDFAQSWDYSPNFSISYFGGSDLFLDKVEIFKILKK